MGYYEMREAKVKIAEELSKRGWEIHGFKEDESDSMTDYYSPAYWYGVATKNGYVLVIDKGYPQKKEEIKKYNHSNTSIKDTKKIEQLKKMTQENGATKGEEENAKELINKLKNKVNENNDKYEIVGYTIEHMANPSNFNWHIEKDGKIYDRGRGISKYREIPSSYEYDIIKMEYKKGYTHYRGFGDEPPKEKILDEKVVKIINQFKALILRFERIASGINSMGDGTKETEQEGLKNKKNEGYELKEITEEITHKKLIELDRKTFKVGDFITFNYHGGVWQITDVGTRKGIYKGVEKIKDTINYENVGSPKRGYQKLKNPKKYYDYQEKIIKGIEDKKIKLYEYKEVTENITKEKWVKIKSDKKINKTNTKINKVDVNKINISNNEFNYNYTLNEDVDTRDNSKLWVMKITDKLSREEYIKVSNYIKSIGGYYSRFKHGFIFKEKPENLLNNITESKTKHVEKSKKHKIMINI
jgi:hypothetical protein